MLSRFVVGRLQLRDSAGHHHVKGRKALAQYEHANLGFSHTSDERNSACHMHLSADYKAGNGMVRKMFNWGQYGDFMGPELESIRAKPPREDDLEEDDLEEGDLEEGDLEKEEYGQDLDFNGVDYDLNYTVNTKNYRVSDKKNEAIKNSMKNRKHIYISVELPRRRSKRSKLFRINEYGDLVIIVDSRNMEHVFGPVIKNLMETLRQRCENKENSMDLTE
ncbi:hypothetical protein C1646_666484 [Rhizophagus diaphanus]|nr:hypothetical protein C1646_666484 [Rhizophagus diaphanus] [Rhizophagus sp. MUCL 43196]